MSGHGLLERMLSDQLIVNGMLIVIAVSTLTSAPSLASAGAR